VSLDPFHWLARPEILPEKIEQVRIEWFFWKEESYWSPFKSYVVSSHIIQSMNK